MIVREGGIKPLLASFKIKKAIVKEWVASTLCNIAYSNGTYSLYEYIELN